MKAASAPPLWTMAFRNVLRRPRRSLLSVTAIGVAAMTMTCLFALVTGLKRDLGDNLQRYLAGQVLVEDRGLIKAGAHALSLAVEDVTNVKARLAAVAGVSAVSPRVAGVASVFVEGDAVFFPFLGMDFSTDPMNLREFLGPGATLPRPGERQALVSTGLAEKLGLRVGDSVTAVTQTLRGSSNGMSFQVTGIVRPGLGSFQTPWLFTSLETAQRFVHLDEGATSLLVSLRPGTEPKPTASVIEGILKATGRDTVTARAWFESAASYGLMDLAQIIYGFIGLVFIALASTVIINTMLMVVLERAKEVGMLAALGMSSRMIRHLFLAEGAVLSASGAFLGTLAGSVISLVLGVTGLDYTEALKGVQLEMSPVLRPVLDPWLPPEIFVLATGVALVFTLLPLRRLRKMQIVDALRGEV